MRSPHNIKQGERYAYRAMSGWSCVWMDRHTAEAWNEANGHYRIPDDPAALPAGSRVVRISDGVEGAYYDDDQFIDWDDGSETYLPAPGLLVALIALPEEDA